MSKSKKRPARKPGPDHKKPSKTEPDLRFRKVPQMPAAQADEQPGGRVEVVRRAIVLLEGGQPGDVVADALAEEFDFSPRMGRKYIRRARQLMHRHLEAEIPFARAARIRSMLDIRRRADAKGDFKTALAAEKEIADLQGLYVHKSEVTNGMTPEVAGLMAAIALNPYDQKRRLAELEAKEKASQTTQTTEAE